MGTRYRFKRIGTCPHLTKFGSCLPSSGGPSRGLHYSYTAEGGLFPRIRKEFGHFNWKRTVKVKMTPRGLPLMIIGS